MRANKAIHQSWTLIKSVFLYFTILSKFLLNNVVQPVTVFLSSSRFKEFCFGFIKINCNVCLNNLDYRILKSGIIFYITDNVFVSKLS